MCALSSVLFGFFLDMKGEMNARKQLQRDGVYLHARMLMLEPETTDKHISKAVERVKELQCESKNVIPQ